MSFKKESIKTLLKYATIGAVAGGVAASETSAGFSRSEDTSYGLKLGAAVGAAGFAMPRIFKNPAVRSTLREVGQVVFRRIHGRIIAMRVR